MFSVSNNSNSDYRNLRKTVNQILQDAPPATSIFSYSQPIKDPPRYHKMQPRQPHHQPPTQAARYHDDPYEFVSSNSVPCNSHHDSVGSGNRQDLGKVCV